MNDRPAISEPSSPALFDYSPWHCWTQATADDRARQSRFQQTLSSTIDGVGCDCGAVQ
ncbi:hypothetical protein [Streptomyces camelliae]|uniref:Uncharacterized protein n=1 Tax=Streptomyces camelliae TaxID=3004093 RepID=A0ABY7NUC6_9ACTN|nr:hypothetical protein [Streptomyces sp. HUAS 2-6]WBO61777.1 hypothetical protein O1G22_02380 [Streptomyces sp. HUAS 2-6]